MIIITLTVTATIYRSAGDCSK